MAVEQYYSSWLSVFKEAGLTEELASEAFNEWASGLDGEICNEFNQTDFSVMVSAEEAITELTQYKS